MKRNDGHLLSAYLRIDRLIFESFKLILICLEVVLRKASRISGVSLIDVVVGLWRVCLKILQGEVRNSTHSSSQWSHAHIKLF